MHNSPTHKAVNGSRDGDPDKEGEEDDSPHEIILHQFHWNNKSNEKPPQKLAALPHHRTYTSNISFFDTIFSQISDTNFLTKILLQIFYTKFLNKIYNTIFFLSTVKDKLKYKLDSSNY